MVGKLETLKQMTWENIQSRWGLERFTARFGTSDLIGFVNWTMLRHENDIWESLLKEVARDWARSGASCFLIWPIPKNERAKTSNARWISSANLKKTFQR